MHLSGLQWRHTGTWSRFPAGGRQPWEGTHQKVSSKPIHASSCPQHSGFPPASRLLWGLCDTGENPRTNCAEWWEEPSTALSHTGPMSSPNHNPSEANQTMTLLHLIGVSSTNRHLQVQSTAPGPHPPRPRQSSTQGWSTSRVSPTNYSRKNRKNSSTLPWDHSTCHHSASDGLQVAEVTHLQPLWMSSHGLTPYPQSFLETTPMQLHFPSSSPSSSCNSALNNMQVSRLTSPGLHK